MNKNTLTIQLAGKLGIPVTASRQYIEALEEVLTESLKAGDPVILQGFGTLSPWQQTGRPGRNPKTGVPCLIAPRCSVKFKPGKGLLERLNSK